MTLPAQPFLGLRAKVEVGRGTDRACSYQLDLEQELLGVLEGQKSWRLVCRQCREAGGTRANPWASSTFFTGKGDINDDEQRHQYERVLEEVKAHVELHERMAAWYEQLAESPARHAGWVEGMADAGRQVQ